MKKINAKKLNQYYMSGNNSPEMKALVQNAVESFMSLEAPNTIAIAVLQDLGLLIEA